jgi:hypothetical protein
VFFGLPAGVALLAALLVFTGCPDPNSGGGGDLTNAATPTITIDLTPADNHIYQNSGSGGGAATKLTIAAKTSDSGTLSYQWKYNTTDITTGGTVIGGNSASFIPPITDNHTRYYFCVVTNTNNSVNGNTTATATSKTVRIKVQDGVPSNAGSPTLGTQPSGTSTHEQGATATSLSVSATSPDGGTLSYQWYKSVDNNPDKGDATVGTGTTYTPSTTAAELGTYYYYAVVTNSVTDKNPGTATTTVATVTVVKTIANAVSISGSGYSGGDLSINDLTNNTKEKGVQEFSTSGTSMTIKLGRPEDKYKATTLTLAPVYAQGDVRSDNTNAEFEVLENVVYGAMGDTWFTQFPLQGTPGTTMALYFYSDTDANLKANAKEYKHNGTIDISFKAFDIPLKQGWNVVEIKLTMESGTKGEAEVSVGTIPYTTAPWKHESK